MTTRLRPVDEGWPYSLDECVLPKVRSLFVSGRPIGPDAPSLAIVGTRRPTAAGLRAATELATALTLQGYRIVSGLAVGIDAAAHRACIDAGGHTIAVLGCGHDIDYPKRNRKLRADIEACGSVVSEYNRDIEPKPFTFPMRNRIISGLSQGVIVVEGGIRSGALVTARLALDQNRDVFAVPGSVRNVMAEGPNELIRRGEAALVTRVEHVLEVLGGVAPARDETLELPLAEVTPEQRTILGHLDDVPESVDGLVRALGLEAPGATTALTMLELQGLARRAARGYVITDRGAAVRARLERSRA